MMNQSKVELLKKIEQQRGCLLQANDCLIEKTATFDRAWVALERFHSIAIIGMSVMVIAGLVKRKQPGSALKTSSNWSGRFANIWLIAQIVNKVISIP